MNAPRDQAPEKLRASRVRKSVDRELKDQALRARVEDVSFWWHSIDLGDGVISPGMKPLQELQSRLADLGLPDLHGKTVLDIGTWDGYFSFAAERLGAARVVALDHYVWAHDYGGEDNPVRDANGRLRRPDQDPVRWRPGEWPGKRGFDLAHEVLGSCVEPLIGDFMTVDLDRLGTFDIVLYLKVLYHIEDPLRALRRLRAVTNELAVIETKGTTFPGLPDVPLCEFFPDDELDGDPTNWWLPNWRALEEMVRTAGFSHVAAERPPPQPTEGQASTRWRTVIHARP